MRFAFLSRYREACGNSGHSEPQKSSLWRTLLGLGVSLVCFVLALRGVSWSELQNALAQASWFWVGLAVLLVIAVTLFKALRWGVLFYPQHVSLGRLWFIFVIGQLLNAVLPARAGEIGRIYFVGQLPQISRSRALSTIVVEKALDFVMLAVGYLIVAIWLVFSHVALPLWLTQLGMWLLPLALLVVGFMAVLTYSGATVWAYLTRFLDRWSHPWSKKLNRAMVQVVDAFALLKSRRINIRLWGWSIVVWLGAALTNWLVFKAFGLSVPHFSAFFLLVILMSGIAVPTLPSNVGVFPYLLMLVLALFDVERATALTVGFILHVVTYGPLLVLGVPALFIENSRRVLVPGRDSQQSEQVSCLIDG